MQVLVLVVSLSLRRVVVHTVCSTIDSSKRDVSVEWEVPIRKHCSLFEMKGYTVRCSGRSERKLRQKGERKLNRRMVESKSETGEMIGGIVDDEGINGKEKGTSEGYDGFFEVGFGRKSGSEGCVSAFDGKMEEEDWSGHELTANTHVLPCQDSGLRTNRGRGVGTSCRDRGGRVTRIFGLMACEATQDVRAIPQVTKHHWKPS